MDARLASYIARLPARPDRQCVDPLAGTAPPGVPFGRQLRAAGLARRFGALMCVHIVATTMLIVSWACIGSGALSGRTDQGWLAAWALCLAAIVPLHVAARWLEGVITIGCGGLLRQRLLAGAMRIDPEVTKRKGLGGLLCEVLESEAIELVGVNRGFELAVAALELLLAPFVLAWGAAAGMEVALLLSWVAMALILLAANTRRRSRWTTVRLDITHRLVEQMTAHRTKVAQQSPSDWHRQEDDDHLRYADLSRSLDRSTTMIEAGLPRGYVIAALALLLPSFVSGGMTVVQLAITLGAVLFAGDALQRLTSAFPGIAAAYIAWRRVKPIFDAAAQPLQGPPEVGSHEGDGANPPPTRSSVLRAEDVIFTHEGRIEAALKGCSLTMEKGDFVLLEGESGGGKSTIASLLTGMRKPSAGVILAGGLDLATLGEATWRRRVAAAPQYHENHILSAPLGLNLLLGRPYPHSDHDLQEARELCDELGLGPLIDRMPAGLDQMVGEAGWQLSQGERGRVFLARALLQNADLVVLDESLTALDPENLHQCLESVFRRAGTLLLIAHP